MSLLLKFKQWRKRRYWNKRQLEHLHDLISADQRWLSHDPVAKALTDRYMAAFNSDWYKLSYEEVSQFRSRIGLDPHNPQKRASSHKW